jgi:hypothetical protein
MLIVQGIHLFPTLVTQLASYAVLLYIIQGDPTPERIKTLAAAPLLLRLLATVIPRKVASLLLISCREGP